MHTVSIPSIAGRTPAQEDASHKLLVKEARLPYQGELDSRYVRISAADVTIAKEMYYNIPIFRTSEQVNKEACRQGGMTIQIGTSTPKTYKTIDAFGAMVMNWALEIYHYQNLHGFAVATFIPAKPNLIELFSNLEDSFNQVKEQLVVLDPEMVDIYHHQNIVGEHEWVVRQRPGQGDFMSAGLLGPIIPHVFVFTREGEGPTPEGRLRSRVLALREDYLELKQARLFAMRAEERRSAPYIITERVPSTKDPQLHGIIPSIDGSCDTKRDSDDNRVTAAEQWADRLVRYSNMFSPEQHAALQNIFLMQSIISGQSTIEEDRVDLPPERKLARQVMAEPPLNLKEREIHFEQKVLQIFGIPPAMIQPESSHGKMVSNENAQEIYRQHLQSIKHELLTPIRLVLRYIYQWKIRLKYLLQHKGEKMPPFRQFYKDTRITVILHGLPPEERLNEWWEKGLLTYEAYIKSLCSIHGIPEQHFEKSPAISREDLLTSGRDSIEKHKAQMQKQDKSSAAKPKTKKRKATSSGSSSGKSKKQKT